MKPENILHSIKWRPPEGWLRIRTIDLHTGGEPLRVITHGIPEIKGRSMLDKRKFFMEKFDYLRTGILFEPRGHADMYGAILTDAVSENADFGTFFLHNEGYSTMCGHAIIALVKMVLETEIIEKPGPLPEVIIDTPAGQINAKAERENDLIKKVYFTNVPSFVIYTDEITHVDGIGEVRFDVAFGGAFYAICEAEQFGFELTTHEYDQLINYGRKIKNTIIDRYRFTHPYEEDLSFLYGTIFTGPARTDKNIHSRNVCIFANGEVDRSPTGTGISARAALLYAKGELPLQKKIIVESILGTTMGVKIKGLATYGTYNAVVPEVSGSAYITAQHIFCFDPEDPLKDGFILR
jgi:trans-L-3-hydroxyproline dehydratase